MIVYRKRAIDIEIIRIVGAGRDAAALLRG
jgi:hypothetical protein